MIVYQSTKDGFQNDVLTNDIDTIIHNAYTITWDGILHLMRPCRGKIP